MSYAMVSGDLALPLPEYVDFDSALVQLSHVNEALHRSQIMAGSVNPGRWSKRGRGRSKS